MIRAVGLGKRYGDHWVFRGVHMELGRGSVAIVGPNGAGKTTLLRVLALLAEPSEGELYVLGRPWRDAVALARGRVLYAHQEPVTIRGTVLQNLALCPHLDWEVVEVLGLGPLLGQKASALSSGYRKLVTIARVAACRPDVALLDEPTAFLDREKREAVLQAIDMLVEGGALVAWSTHYPPEAERAGQTYEVYDGAVRRVK